MSTRSNIIVHCLDGKWRRVYCHFDGYLSGVGATLAKHYATRKKASALVEPGDISVLAPRCNKPSKAMPGLYYINGFWKLRNVEHSFETPCKGYTVYYSRDRGERSAVACVGDSLKDVWPGSDTWVEFVYWMGDDGIWWVIEPDACVGDMPLRVDVALKHLDGDKYRPLSEVRQNIYSHKE